MNRNSFRPQIAKPFSSKPQALGFAALVIFFLALPALLSAFNAPSREAAYAGGGKNFDSFHIKELFEKKDPVDIAIIGLSTVWVGIDSGRLEERLASRLGRKATVFTLGANHVGEDLVYVMAKDLVEHRRVKMVILAPPPRRQPASHPHIHYLLQYGVHRDSWEGLTPLEQARFYALCVLGAPRQALSVLRADIQRGPKQFLAANNGTWIRELGWEDKTGEKFVSNKIEPFTEDPRAFIHMKGVNEDRIEFNEVMSPYQEYFFRKTIEVLKENGVKVALLYLPLHDERKLEKIPIRAAYEDTLGLNVPIIGMEPARLFAGRSDTEIQSLYYNKNHFNRNGTEFFTGAITPAIIGSYLEEGI